MGEHIETYLEIQKPISRTVFVINYDGIQSSFFLNFPYIVFYGIKGSRYLFVGCCDEKPNLNSIIYFLPLSNISTSGRVCSIGRCRSRFERSNRIIFGLVYLTLLDLGYVMIYLNHCLGI